MRLAWIVTLLALLLPVAAPAPASAGPQVVATIAPLHSLAVQVMEGAGAPDLLLPPGASLHDHALRPSEAAALQGAAIVLRLGAGLEPWLDRPLSALASDAAVLELAEVPGVTLLAPREDAAFDAGGDDHGHGHDDGHGQGTADPHLWLDPENARTWLAAIAEALAAADPANAALYRANATAAKAGLDRLVGAAEARLAPVRGRPFLVFHDAFQYFERRFAIEAAGAVAASDARMPGPARIAAIRARIAETGAVCLFREPQFRSGLAETVAEGTGVRIGELDPLGAGLAPGAGLYSALIEAIAAGIADCLG